MLEVNTSGHTWHFSSPRGEKAQREFGFRFDEQLGGLERAGRILAERARHLAR